jgi:hypothetical protein
LVEAPIEVGLIEGFLVGMGLRALNNTLKKIVDRIFF